jgi:hypothetical protein
MKIDDFTSNVGESGCMIKYPSRGFARLIFRISSPDLAQMKKKPKYIIGRLIRPAPL